jgi:uncharacterized coiled-coil protein SlyX
MDEELARMVKDMVSEFVFDLQFEMADLRDQIAALEGKLHSPKATAGGAAATMEPTYEIQGRLVSLEAAAAATSRGLEELQASLARAPVAGPQRAATCQDVRQLEQKMSTLASEVALAKRATDREPRSQAILQKFGDVEVAQSALEAAQAALREQVAAMEDQIGHSRIGSAVFALNAIGLKEGDRKMCLDRLKGEEERLKQGLIGTMPGGQTGLIGAVTLSPCSSGSSISSGSDAVPAPSSKHENRFKFLWKRSTL